jgi:predicted nucleotide-binding protein (sugar kinase/HSP70/actin superfamily)
MGEGWLLTGEMVELIRADCPNIVCTQPFACLPNHVVGKAVIKELRRRYPQSNIVAVDYDPGASEVNQLNRIKLMIAVAKSNLQEQERTAKSARDKFVQTEAGALTPQAETLAGQIDVEQNRLN